MRDILTDGLPILDLLEITPSTTSVAALTNCDQSSVSRIDRHVSQLLRIQSEFFTSSLNDFPLNFRKNIDFVF